MIRQNRFKRFLLRWWKRLWWRVLLLAFLFGSFWVLVWPAVEWFLLPSLPLDAMIVNYTMPYKDDRKHRGLFWVLRHLKVQPPAQRSSWDGLRDYIGYRPSLPPRAAEKLAQRKRRRPGLLYVTDTYGVYRDDLKDEWRKLYIDRSPLVFGGLSMEDARLMERWIRAGTHLFLEFNSMCPPTGPGARKLLQSLLGVSWTGWIGKVFPDPTDLRVAPLWLKRDFKKQYPRRKFPTTPTLFLFNHKGGMLYTSAPKLRSVMPILHLTPAGKNASL